MANKFKRLFPELTQGVEVPIEEQKYDAPREIAGPAKPIEAVVPRFLTDTITGVPGMAAGVLRAMADYYPEKFSKTTKTKTEEASLPEWLLTAITDPNYRNTEAGKKAIEYAQKQLDPFNKAGKEALMRKLAQREERMLQENTDKYIQPMLKLQNELPLVDEGFKLTKVPKQHPLFQQWDLETPHGTLEDWIMIKPDSENVPSIGYLRDLPDQLQGNSLGAQAYTALAKEYGTLRSDPTGATSTDATNKIWNKIGQPFDYQWGEGYGIDKRYELPFKHNMIEKNAPIKERYKQLGDKSEDELDLLRHIIKAKK